MSPAYRGNLCRLFIIILIVYLLIVVITLATNSILEVRQLLQVKINNAAYYKWGPTQLLQPVYLRSFTHQDAVDPTSIRKNEADATAVKFSYVDVNNLIGKSKVSSGNRTSDVTHSYVNVNVSDDGCDDVTFNEKLSSIEDWLPVASHDAVYVFSAYHDYSTPDVITVTSISVRYQKIICQFWYGHPETGTVSLRHENGYVNLLPEGHDKRFVASVIKCPIRNQTIPTYVSIVTERCQTPKNVLRVREIFRNRTVRKFTVCVTPLNFRYSKMDELIEWIELNRILGAERFVFYNFSTSASINKVLRYYEQQNLVEVVKWSLPVKVDVWPPVHGYRSALHYFGQLIALKECLMRSKQDSVFVVNEDLDEFIIPYGANVTNWDQMLQTMPNRAWYSFRNVFFRKEWNDTKFDFDGKKTAARYNMVTLLKTLREKTVFKHGTRSKYIVRTDAGKQIGVHGVYQTFYGDWLPVPNDVALLHHYRNWEQDNDHQPRQRETIVVNRYNYTLIKNVRKVWSVFE